MYEQRFIELWAQFYRRKRPWATYTFAIELVEILIYG
jgi:hypothetical protein